MNFSQTFVALVSPSGKGPVKSRCQQTCRPLRRPIVDPLCQYLMALSDAFAHTHWIIEDSGILQMMFFRPVDKNRTTVIMNLTFHSMST